ncbi:MAG: L,D-transpeptidase family protein [Candidatus Aquicultor sp.]|nr:L,D-transpeptidase family protein [Candidatus Aquicultor sp.]
MCVLGNFGDSVRIAIIMLSIKQIPHDKNIPSRAAFLGLSVLFILFIAGCGGQKIAVKPAEPTTTILNQTSTTTEATSTTTTTSEATTSTPDSSVTTTTITSLPGTAQETTESVAGQAPGTSQAATSTPEPQATAQRTLRQGLGGEDVRRLQEKLVSLGYSPGAVDGSYSAQTRHAVIAFQKVNGLARDGVAGPKTLAAVGSPATIIARHTGDHIEVSKARQVLLVVKGGVVERIINASTGKKGFTTPAVSSAVDWKAGKYYESKKYGGIMVWSSFFYGGIAVHGFGSVPSYPASHGCIRIPIPDSKYVYDNMPVRSMVYVY